MSAELRQVAEYRVKPPPTWASVPTMPQEGQWADPVAALLCADEAARSDLARRLESVHTEMLNGRQPLPMALWAPQPEIPAVLGAMRIELIVQGSGPLPTLENYRHLVENRSHKREAEQLEQRLEEVDLPAGLTLMERQLIGRKTTGSA
jgi:hypothetical protein